MQFGSLLFHILLAISGILTEADVGVSFIQGGIARQRTSRILSHHSVEKGTEDIPSIFDDEIFQLTREAKDELRTELGNASVKEALAWARKGNSVRHSFSVSRKQGNSVSVLQEAFIFLLRFLAKTKMLPFTGDRTYHGTKLWTARQHDSPYEVLDRYWMDRYFADINKMVKGPVCLEWGINYIRSFSQCTEKVSLTYAPGMMHVDGDNIHGDIYELQKANRTFDFIMAPQIFEHLEFPDRAVGSLFQSTSPGGAVAVTLPQSSQFHLVPEDYLRYTKMKVRAMFEKAGFCMPKELMAGAGDFIFQAAAYMGMRKSDFNDEELEMGYQRGYDAISDGAISIFAIAYKPPHEKCTGQAIE